MPSDPNPLRGPARSDGWAQLTRLAGDRAAVLLQAFRQELGRISGLQEQLFRPAPDEPWALRYRIGEEILFTMRIGPGLVEAVIPADSALRAALAHSSSFGRDHSLRQFRAVTTDESAEIRFRIGNREDVRLFVNLALKAVNIDGRRSPQA
jgi:hypothetical protein